MPGNIIREDLDRRIAIPFDINSPNALFTRSGLGRFATNVKFTTAIGSPVSINVFKLTEAFEATLLLGYIILDTDTSDITDIYFDIWDGSTSVVLSKVTGSSLSGFQFGGNFSKVGVAADNLVTLNSDQPRIYESAAKRTVAAFRISTNLLADTFLRFNYTCATTITAGFAFVLGYITISDYELVFPV